MDFNMHSLFFRISERLSTGAFPLYKNNSLNVSEKMSSYFEFLNVRAHSLRV